MNKRPTLNEILDASSKIVGLTEEEVKSRGKKTKCNICRGLFYLTAWNFGYHPKMIAETVYRSRTSCIVTINRYRGYAKFDRKIRELHNRIIERLNCNIDNG